MKSRYSAIYAPRGAAAEYSELAVNLHEGCRNQCKYCYVPRTLHVDPVKFHARELPRIGIVDKIERDLAEMRAVGDRRRVLMCFSCDPYPTHDESIITSLVLEQFNWYEQPFSILTKGGMFAVDDFELERKT